ncbi:MAG: thymidylate kinase, partial [Alphaproteobacteria bacterium]|nr:thymidylate kinase [Alphaproteobacteria bacterium]
ANQRNGAADAAEDRYERMDVAFHERLRAGFLAIAAAEPDRCLVIDGGGEPDDVAARIWAAVASKFAGDISTFGGAGD